MCILLQFCTKQQYIHSWPTPVKAANTSLMPGFWNSSYPENLELSLEQETAAF